MPGIVELAASGVVQEVLPLLQLVASVSEAPENAAQASLAFCSRTGATVLLARGQRLLPVPSEVL